MLRETCTCGAGFEAQGKDYDVIRNEIHGWRAQHRCGLRLDTVSAQSTTASVVEIGFNTSEAAT